MVRYIFLFLLLFLISCNKSEFKLEFNLEGDVTENFNATYFATDKDGGGVTVQAVASVRQGQCILAGMTKLPTLVYISTRKNLFPLVVYADRTYDIKISGYGSDPMLWKVEGDKINEKITSWRLENQSIWKEENTDSVNAAVKNFVEKNPRDPVSTILMLCYFNRATDEKQYNELMASLKGEARASEWLSKTARADQLYHSYSFPARLQSLVMRGNRHFSDTLLTDGKNPVFMLFWQTGYSDRKSHIDSLKLLEKEVEDSIRIMADVCLDADSAGWRNAIRRDSLDEKMKRLWTPLGLNDPTIHKLKVSSLPYFIVFDGEGNQDYRGREISEAMKAYRELLESSDSVKKSSDTLKK